MKGMLIANPAKEFDKSLKPSIHDIRVDANTSALNKKDNRQCKFFST